MIHVKFETSPFERNLAKLISFIKYRLMRPAISWLEYHVHYKYHLESKRVTASGSPLKKGITYCLVAKDESDTIEYCLQSLVGFADQLISIDNGSGDDTLLKMLKFKERFGHAMDIVVMSRPEMNLMQCRQECLEHITYNWFMRGDADFVLTDSYKNAKNKILDLKRPSAVAYRLLTLFGDEHHCNKYHDAVSPGEYYLRNFEQEIRYEEFYGRLEHARIPIYYRLIRNPSIGIIHLDCNKSNERIFYRTCYLDYREHLNNFPETAIAFNQYEEKWRLNVFKTLDQELLSYRMARLLAVMCGKLNPLYATSIQKDTTDLISSLYRIAYREGQPFLRVKKNVDEASIEDRILRMENNSWIPDPNAFYSDSVRKAFSCDD